jgi:TRAP-type C4-dicarboxylate transport system permease small subunit
VPTPQPKPAQPAPGRRLRRLLEAAVLAAFLGFIGWAAVRQWRQVSTVIGELSGLAVAASMAATLAGIWFSFLCWRAILARSPPACGSSSSARPASMSPARCGRS